MKLFIIGIIAVFTSLYFQAESDPLQIKPALANYAGAKPLDAFASSHAIVNDVSFVSDVEMDWDTSSRSYYIHVNEAMEQMSSELDSICENAGDDFRATPEFNQYCYSE